MSQMRCFRAVLFDVDDTLMYLDPPITGLFLAACAECGLMVHEEDVRRGVAEVASFMREEGLRYIGDEESLWRDILSLMLRACGHDDPSGQTARRVRQYIGPRARTRAFPDVEPALIALRERGLRLAAVTGRMNSSASLLEELGLLHYFESYTYAGELLVTKPDPRLYQSVLKRVGVTSEQALLVGNGPLDMVGAQGAGILPVMIDRKERHRSAAWLRIEDLRQLPALMGELEARQLE